MRDLVEKHRTAVLFISHNLGVVREFADRVYVIYKGRIVEQASAAEPVRRSAPSLHAGAAQGRAAHHRRRHSATSKMRSADYFAPLVVHDGCRRAGESGRMSASAALAPLGLEDLHARRADEVRAVDDVSLRRRATASAWRWSASPDPASRPSPT